MFVTILSADSLLLGIGAGACIMDRRSRAAIALTFGLADALATAASPYLWDRAVTAGAVLALSSAATALLAGLSRANQRAIWVGVAGLASIDNLLIPALPGDILPAFAESAVGAAIGILLGHLAVHRSRLTSAELAWGSVAAACAAAIGVT